jgi:hypothetical protein
MIVPLPYQRLPQAVRHRTHGGALSPSQAHRLTAALIAGLAIVDRRAIGYAVRVIERLMPEEPALAN